MFRHRREAGEHGDRLEPVEVMRAGSWRDGNAVAAEEEIEFPGLRKPRLFLVVAKIRAGAGLRIRMPPIAPAHAVAVQDEAEFQLPFMRAAHLRSPLVPGPEIS